MQELFYEESAFVHNAKLANRKYIVIRFISVASYISLGFWLFICNFYGLTGNVIFDMLCVLGPAIMFLFLGIFFGRLKNKYYVDYDYTFVSGSIRISKVVKNIKRKSLIKFETRDIEKIGKHGSSAFYKYEQMPGITKMVMTSNSSPYENKDFYFFAINHEGEKKLLILEASITFISYVLKFSNRNILDEEFLKELSKAKN